MKKQFTNKARYLGLKLTAIIFALLLFVSGQSWGQISSLELGTASQSANTTGAATFTSKDANISTLPTLSLTVGQQGQAGGNGYVASKAWNNASLTTTTYWQFTVTAASGYQISVTSLALRMYRSSTGPPSIALASDVDSYASTIGGVQTLASATYSTITFSGLTLSNKSSITFRVYAYGASSATGTLRLGDAAASSLDINLTGTVTSTGNTAPTVTTQAPSSILTTTATGNGNITATGGVNPTARGFCWDLAANADPDISDSKVEETGTFSTGAFTGSITGLTAGTQYKVRAYATNSVGTSYGSVQTFYTLSTEPSVYSTTFTNSVISQTQIDLSFDAASTISNATGYLILKKTGSPAPTGTPTDGNAYPVGTVIGDGTVAALVTSTSATSASITGLTAGTNYYFTIIPYSNNVASNTTYNYKIDGTIPSTNGTTLAPLATTSEVSGPALDGQPNPTLISSLTTTDVAAVRVLDMDIYDYGVDTDPTKITQVTIKAGTHNTADWAATIQGVKLSTDGGSTFVTIGTPTINASSIIIPISSGNLNIPNDNALTVSMYVYLKSSGLTDNSILEFKVDATASSHGFTADATGSTLLATFASAPVSNEILVDVEATKLAFVQQPSNTSPNVAMTPAVTVEATDANNNRDIDYATDINITSSGTLTGSPVAVTPASGIATFSTLTHTVVGNNLTLTAASGTLSNAISNNFSISSLLLVEDFDYANGALLTANGWTAHSTGINPITVATNSISYSNYLSSNVGKEITLATSGEDINKTFTAQTSGSVYASFLVNVTSSQTTGDYFFHIGPTPTSGNIYQGRIYIKKDASTTNFAFGLNKASTAGTLVYSGFNYVPGTTYLVVLKYKFNTGSTTDDVVSLFINPTLNSIEPTPLLTVTDATITDLTKADFVALRQGSSSNAAGLIIDGIRVSTNWSDIVGITPTFTGTGNWTETARWNTGSTPGTTAYAIIDGDATISGNVEVADITINASKKLTVATTGNLKVTGTLTNNAGNTGLVLKSDATGTASLIHNTASVNATAQRYIAKDNKWHFLSSPVAAQAIKPNFAPTTCDQTFDFYKWDANADLTSPASTPWVNLRADATTYEPSFETNFAVGRGYLVAYSSSYVGSETHEFTGTLNSGDKSIAVVYDANNKFNLIGNPFASAIDWNSNGYTGITSVLSVDNNNNSSIWIWNGGTTGQYGVFNNSAGGTNGVTNIIAPHQGFFVEAQAGGSFTIPNAARVHPGTQNFLKSTPVDLLKLKVTSTANTYSDEIIVNFNSNATANQGAAKWFSMISTAPSLYSVKNAKNYTINTLAAINADLIVPVGFKAGVNGNYSIKASELASFTNLSNLILKDLQTGITQNLLQNPVYNFASSTADNANRFQLIFNSTSGINNLTNNSSVIYYADNQIQIQSNNQIERLEIYNAIGQLVYQSNTKSNQLSVNVSDFTRGTYIVRLIANQKIQTQKLIINN